MIIDLNDILQYIDSEEEYYDAPCSPLDETFQPPTVYKSYQQKKLQSPDCAKNMTECKIRFEVPEVCTMVKLILFKLSLPLFTAYLCDLITNRPCFHPF